MRLCLTVPRIFILGSVDASRICLAPRRPVRSSVSSLSQYYFYFIYTAIYLPARGCVSIRSQKLLAFCWFAGQNGPCRLPSALQQTSFLDSHTSPCCIASGQWLRSSFTATWYAQSCAPMPHSSQDKAQIEPKLRNIIQSFAKIF